MNPHTEHDPLVTLANVPRWVSWRIEVRNGEETKIPYCAYGKAKSNDPKTWMLRSEAEANARSKGHNGIGIQLGPIDADEYLIGLDLDSCRDPETGEIKEWARLAVETIGSYTEISPSNTGLKIFALASAEVIGAIRANLTPGGAVTWKGGSGKHPPCIDLYTASRYFTVTGLHLDGAPYCPRHVTEAQLRTLIDEIGPMLTGKKDRKNVDETKADHNEQRSSRTGWDALVAWAASGNSRDHIKALQLIAGGVHIGQHDQSRSACEFAFAAVCKAAGLTEAQFVEALTEWAARGFGYGPGDSRSAHDQQRAWQRCWANVKSAQGEDKGTGFRFVAVSDLEYAPPDFLVEGLIERDTLGLVFGDPGCGKSFLGVDLALSVATDHPFHNRPVRQGAVFYIAGEGHNGLVRRFHAWAVERGQSLEGVPLFKSECAAQFLDPKSAQSVEHAISELAAQHGAPAMVIVDTLARNFGPGDENSTQEMSAFVAAMDKLRSKLPRCVILIIHHSGHHDKERGRGSMALKGALDFEYRLAKIGETMRLTNTKMKDAEPPRDMVFTLKGVLLLEGAKSAALVSSEEHEEADIKARPKMSRDARLAQDTFAEVAASLGADSGFQIELEPWRTAFYAKHTGDNPASKRQAFKRGRDALVDQKLIEAENDVYRCIDPEMRLAINLHRKQRDKRDVT